MSFSSPLPVLIPRTDRWVTPQTWGHVCGLCLINAFEMPVDRAGSTFRIYTLRLFDSSLLGLSKCVYERKQFLEFFFHALHIHDNLSNSLLIATLQLEEKFIIVLSLAERIKPFSNYQSRVIDI